MSLLHGKAAETKISFSDNLFSSDPETRRPLVFSVTSSP